MPSAKQIELVDGRTACAYQYLEGSSKFTIAMGKLYRRSLFDGVRYPVGRLHEDEATSYRLLYAAKLIAVLRENYYYYRDNPAGIMRSFSRGKFDALTVLAERKTFFSEKQEAYLAELTQWKYCLTQVRLIFYALLEGKPELIPQAYRLSLDDAFERAREAVPVGVDWNTRSILEKSYLDSCLTLALDAKKRGEKRLYQEAGRQICRYLHQHGFHVITNKQIFWKTRVFYFIKFSAVNHHWERIKRAE